jgi:hypothetical protein
MKFKPGQEVWVACEVKPGPLDEKYIVVETTKGPISGFVKNDQLRDPNALQTRVRSRLLEVHRGTAKVRLRGSFFNTAMGLALVTADHLAA